MNGIKISLNHYKIIDISSCALCIYAYTLTWPSPNEAFHLHEWMNEQMNKMNEWMKEWQTECSKIPTTHRQTSWLYTKQTQGVELGETKNKSRE